MENKKQSKIGKYFEEHENIAQLIKFTIISMLAFVIEYTSFTLIILLLRGYKTEVVWWIFSYTEANGGAGAMIGFFVSTVLAQITAFIINRKKTFKATNNIVFSAVSYAFMVLGIVILNTWAGSAITSAVNKTIDNLTVCQYIGKFAGSFMAFVITFVMSKFVIMRRVEPKNA
ncbi:MAG: hypothetical protein ACOX3U_07905 [Christensenellales bacterium]|jgi:putative flippase GtrA